MFPQETAAVSLWWIESLYPKLHQQIWKTGASLHFQDTWDLPEDVSTDHRTLCMFEALGVHTSQKGPWRCCLYIYTCKVVLQVWESCVHRNSVSESTIGKQKGSLLSCTIFPYTLLLQGKLQDYVWPQRCQIHSVPSAPGSLHWADEDFLHTKKQWRKSAWTPICLLQNAMEWVNPFEVE